MKRLGALWYTWGMATARLPQKSLIGKRIRLILCNVPDIKPGAYGRVVIVEGDKVYARWEDNLGWDKHPLSWSDGDRWMVVPG